MRGFLDPLTSIHGIRYTAIIIASLVFVNRKGTAAGGQTEPLPMPKSVGTGPVAVGPVSAPKVLSPVEVKGLSGRAIILTAPADWKSVRWLRCDDDSDLIPDSVKPTAVFVTPKPGIYKVFAIPDSGEPLTLLISVAGPRPPDPKPPDPPPVDPFAKELQDLYLASPNPEALSKLAALYKAAAGLARDPETKTAGQLAEAVRRAGASQLGSDILVAMRRRIAQEVAAGMPADPDAVMDEQIRLKAVALYERIAKALEGVVK